MKIPTVKIKIYRYTIKFLMICTLISASITYVTAQYYSAEELRELVKRAGRRGKRGKNTFNLSLIDDSE